LLPSPGRLRLPPPRDEEFKRGRRYFYNRKFNIARKYFLKVLEKKPDHGLALSLLGDISLQKEEWAQAMAYYKQALEVSVNPAIEHYRLGQVQTGLRESAGAIKNYENALRLDPALKISLFQLGYVYLVLERDKKNTIRYWQEFVDGSPDDYQADKIRQILVLLRQEDFKLPPRNSDVSLKEALLLGGKTVNAASGKTVDKEAGHEKSKTRNKSKGLLDDPEL